MSNFVFTKRSTSKTDGELGGDLQGRVFAAVEAAKTQTMRYLCTSGSIATMGGGKGGKSTSHGVVDLRPFT